MSDYHYQIAILRGSENEAWDRANQLLYDVRCSLVLRTKARIVKKHRPRWGEKEAMVLKLGVISEV